MNFDHTYVIPAGEIPANITAYLDSLEAALIATGYFSSVSQSANALTMLHTLSGRKIKFNVWYDSGVYMKITFRNSTDTADISDPGQVRIYGYPATMTFKGIMNNNGFLLYYYGGTGIRLAFSNKAANEKWYVGISSTADLAAQTVFDELDTAYGTIFSPTGYVYQYDTGDIPLIPALLLKNSKVITEFTNIYTMPIIGAAGWYDFVTGERGIYASDQASRYTGYIV